MQSTPGSAPTRDSYHHGSLRAALLDGARAMLAERGTAGFSLNALARRLGVSTAAPYRHFADRDALLDALGDEGYVAFGAGLDAAVRAATDPRDRLQRIGVSYLDFAAENPALFQIMFADREGRPAEVGPPTFQPLVQAVVDAREAGALPTGIDPLVASRTIWATLHGLAVLESRAGLAKLGLSDTHERLVADAFAMLLR